MVTTTKSYFDFFRELIKEIQNKKDYINFVAVLFGVTGIFLNINKEDKTVPRAVEKAVPQIEKLVKVVAKKLKWVLEKENISNQGKAATNVFYVSDYTTSFEQSTKIFFKGDIKLERMNLWE